MNKNQSLDQYDSISDVGKFYEIILNLLTSTLRPQLRIHANEPSGSRDGQWTKYTCINPNVNIYKP